MTRHISWVLVVWAAAASAQTSVVVGSADVARNVGGVCLSEILIRTTQPYNPSQMGEAQHMAEGLLEKIHKGENFTEVARKYSQGPSAGLGGEVGEFRRGQLPKQIEDVVFAMKSGDVSDVIRTKQGFVILQVSDCMRAPVNAFPKSVEILSDTAGVDFGAYVQGVEQSIQTNWYHRIPEAARRLRGKVAIEFHILKDGHSDRTKIVASSGDEELDRAAFWAIATLDPFPPLPIQFAGPYLALRLRFYYNPQPD